MISAFYFLCTVLDDDEDCESNTYRYFRAGTVFPLLFRGGGINRLRDSIHFECWFYSDDDFISQLIFVRITGFPYASPFVRIYVITGGLIGCRVNVNEGRPSRLNETENIEKTN